MILITGSTGNVGKYLVPNLLKTGANVRVLVRDRKKAEVFGEKVSVAVGDLDKPETLLPAMQDITKIYIVTPDTKQVSNLLQAAKQNGVKHVVKQSTIEAGRSLGPGKWHRQQEELIKSMKFQWTFLRPTMMMVNTIDWWKETIKQQNAVYFPGGKAKVPAVASQDIAAVACKALTEPGHEGKIYDITGPEALSIEEMVNTLSKNLNKSIKYVDVPILAAGMSLIQFGLPLYVINGLMHTLRALRHSEYEYITYAVEHIGGVKGKTYSQWCTENKSAFQ
ncbi:MAG: SDR family oxidoreductase [Anaerolineae bacterium]|nr:SDR family oxidoreductase [Anaerolineae bacterium]